MATGTKALVVGGTSGIGYAIARQVATEANSSVIISGRTKPSDIHEQHSNIEFRPLDASSMRAIQQYTDDLKSKNEQKLDFLIMSQGIYTNQGRTETSEGIDRRMALHYYGKQLLIRELLPLLKDDAKVIIILHAGRGHPNELDWEDLDLKNEFTSSAAADHNVTMTDAMIQIFAAQQNQNQNRDAHRHFVHAYPGLVDTNLFQGLPWYIRPVAKAATMMFSITPEECAQNLLGGIPESVALSEREGKYWSCVQEKGQLITDKASWTEEQLRIVEEHTWKIINGALAK